jgi:agmatinase
MISVLGIPFDGNSSFMAGAAQAPARIREAFHSSSSNYFTESGTDLQNHTGWRDAGDLTFGTTHFAETIREDVTSLAAKGHRVLSLGGDHSITFPIVEALHSIHGPLSILHLDAHADLYHDFEGNPFSHASPFARILERGLAKQLVQAGIRTLNTHQRAQAQRWGVEVIEMKNWSDLHRFSFEGPVYLSLDIDAIDPAYAPGVSHHEPGGFTSRQIINLLQNLELELVGADIVELNPQRDASGITAMLAAKLFKELLDVMLRAR